jgi:hypothetical protein
MNLRLISILIAIIVIMGLASARMLSEYLKMKDEKANVQSLYSNKIKEIEVYKSRDGQMVHRNEALNLENKTIKELVRDGQLSQLKQLEGINKRMNNLEFIYQITAKALDSVKVRLQDTTRYYVNDKGDTLIFKATDFKYNDKWASFKAKQITPDSSILTYSVTAPLTGAMYWKRKVPILWIFSKKEYFGEITSENPHIVIPELLNIKVGRKK